MIWTQKLWIFTVFLAVLSDVGAFNVSIRQEQYEELKGSSVTLHCNFDWKSDTPDLAIISWSALGTQPGDQEVLILSHYYPLKVTEIKPQYEDRAALHFDVLKGKANLRLSSLTVTDDNIYECRLWIRNKEEKRQADTTRLVVVEPVSKPICEIQGTVRQGENINLTCYSEEGSPPPSYKWEKWKKTMGFRRQFMDWTATQNGGVLSLYNISRETAGLYTCTSKNKVRASVCDVNLTVLPNFPRPVFLGALTGVVAEAVAGVVAGAAISVASVADTVMLGLVDRDGGQTTEKAP